MNFCTETAEIWQFLGKLLNVVKIIIPILILAFGMLDFGNAVVASKDDEIKKALKSLMFRILSGTIIFFIPVIIQFAFSLIAGFNDTIKDDYENCVACLTNPSDPDGICEQNIKSKTQATGGNNENSNNGG